MVAQNPMATVEEQWLSVIRAQAGCGFAYAQDIKLNRKYVVFKLLGNNVAVFDAHIGYRRAPSRFMARNGLREHASNVYHDLMFLSG